MSSFPLSLLAGVIIVKNIIIVRKAEKSKTVNESVKFAAVLP
jgi:hypothetical protein